MAQPNVILCVCDQLRAFEVGCYGHPVVRTPNLDRLAAEGVRFEIACANHPVCSPSRASLLTGQSSRTCTGMRGNVGDPEPQRRQLRDPTIAEAFRAAGYHTASIGKWHMLPRPDLVGFDYWVYPQWYHRHSARTFFDNSGCGFTVEGWSWDYEMNLVRSYLANHGDRPFFLYFNIEPPHMPLADAPEHYKDLYPRSQVQLRPNALIDGQPARSDDWFKIYLWDHQYYRDKLPHTVELPEGFDLYDLTRMYWGFTTLVDDQVGKLMQTLEASGLAEDTLVLFTSDHGDNLGSHGLFNKDRLTEESIRVPLIVHWPGQLAHRTVRTQVAALVDVMPTLLGLTGVPVPNTVQGIDLSPVVRGQQTSVGPNAAFLEVLHAGLDPWRFQSGQKLTGAIGIRTLDHLYGMALRDSSAYQYSPGNDDIIDERLLFYDLRTDPFELRNLARTEEQADGATDLRKRLRQWHERIPWMTSVCPAD